MLVSSDLFLCNADTSKDCKTLQITVPGFKLRGLQLKTKLEKSASSRSPDRIYCLLQAGRFHIER